MCYVFVILVLCFFFFQKRSQEGHCVSKTLGSPILGDWCNGFMSVIHKRGQSIKLGI